MPQSTFRFKEFTILQDRCQMKVGTDGVILGAWTEMPVSGSILDIGTGTGVIALMAAQKTMAEITAIEPDEDSYKQAMENITASNWRGRIHLLNSSVQEYRPEIKFDLIISNPPFHDETILSPDQKKNNARHTASLPPEMLIESVCRLISPTGQASVIYPYRQYGNLCSLINANNMYLSRVTKVRPVPGKDFHRVLIQFGPEKRDITESELEIEKGPRHHYSDDYKKLTEAFYLYFRH